MMVSGPETGDKPRDSDGMLWLSSGVGGELGGVVDADGEGVRGEGADG